MYKKIGNLIIWIVVVAFSITILHGNLMKESLKRVISPEVLSSAEYREQNLGESMCTFLQGDRNVGKKVGIYLLECEFGYQPWEKEPSNYAFSQMEKKWRKQDGWDPYLEMTEAIWNDVKYFPIPEFTNANLTVSYANTWMTERNYGGKRGHEGTDLMASRNERGIYPIVSMTDGIVSKKGWLEKGGYRIGVTAPNGTYFYYAHLASYANLEEGDEVKAGDILGYMGDSGYGPEGTVGQFAVHLHLGIYIYPEGKEVSINPYWVLRYIENKKVKCYTEV